MTDMNQESDLRWLTEAAELSAQGMAAGAGGPFGAVIVCQGTVVGRGWNQVTSTNDPTAHAEMVAIRSACATLGRFDLRGAVIYSSCEPCPMCLSAIYWARLDRLVFANSREQAAMIGFDDALIYREVAQPLADRMLPCQHQPLPAAAAVFQAWQDNPDRVPY
jgi:guanine deaminase